MLYERCGSYEHAEEAFTGVLKMDPNSDKKTEILFRLGTIYKQTQKCFSFLFGKQTQKCFLIFFVLARQADATVLFDFLFWQVDAKVQCF